MDKGKSFLNVSIEVKANIAKVSVCFLAVENLYYIYCFLKENKEKITSLQKGAAQPHVYARDINALELLLPPSDILRIFNQFTEKIFIEIGKLEKQTITLQQTREYLLPKLMNGEIEV